MHETSINKVRELLSTHVPSGTITKTFEVGALDDTFSYRKVLLEHSPNVKYVGIDILEGPNVDFIDSAYLLHDSVKRHGNPDLVLSGQMLEHLHEPLKAIFAMSTVLQPGGHILLLAPSKEHEHKHPYDCWRILPDTFRYALRENFEILDCGTADHGYYGDTWVIARKSK